MDRERRSRATRGLLVAATVAFIAGSCGSASDPGATAAGPGAAVSDASAPAVGGSSGRPGAVTTAAPEPTAVPQGREERLARAWLAAHGAAGGAAYELVASGPAPPAGPGSPPWMGKFLDAGTGRIVVVYVTSTGEALDEAGMAAWLRQATPDGRPALDRKADDALRLALRSAGPQDRLGVAIWVAADTSAALAAVRARYPNVDWSDGLPASDDAALLDEIRAAIYAAKAAVYRAAEQPVADLVAARGGVATSTSRSAPLVLAAATPRDLAAVAERADVIEIDLDAAASGGG